MITEYLNARWHAYTADGTSWFDSLHPDDRERVRDAWRSAAATGEAFTVECRIRRWDGQYRWHLSGAVPMKDESGALACWFGTDTDIHVQKELQEQLAQAKEAAEEANRTKSVFLANVSHEIRTPLGAMVGFCELLREPRLSDEDRIAYADIISRNGRELTSLIDDILDLSKVEAGCLDIARRPVSLATLLGDVAQSLSLRAREKGIELELHMQADVPDTIMTDPMRLRQILVNIIGNAVKFTERGGVVVDVRLEGGRLIAIEVRDSGIGIPAAAQGRLFRAFSQADEATSRRFGGTGLGLQLSRRLAQLLGGDVTLVKSEVGRGSSFVVTIDPGDFSMTPTDERPPCKAEAGHGSLQGLRVLLAEDAPDNQYLISYLLKKNGAYVDVVDNGSEAVRQVLSADYDIVLMDIQMPVLDGFDATRELRRRGFDRPIIALTAHAMREEREECMRAGCTDHLSKPIDSERLIETVAGHALLH
jgi:signal transduction histidine kinase/BarA-like signal transduction histidine kinase